MSGKTKKLTIVDTELPKWYDGAKYTEGDLVENPFTGEQAILTPNELAMYDLIKGAEAFGKYDIMAKGLDWFRGANARAYMILLD
tara:strand:- start:453 stop:707 length:255 start_codon:yes stop_codon:yes gene_type:complete